MTKETGVPKLKGAANLAIWLFRLEKHMTAKGTWEAVEFVPYRQSTGQTTPPTSVAPDGASQESVRETIETNTPSPGQTEADLEKKRKFGDASNYQKFDFGLDFTEKQNDWVLHPDNDKAINDIVIHCEDVPARKVDGILAARWVINTLIKQYKVNTELQKYLVVERI